MSADLALVRTQVGYEQKSYWRNPLAASFTFLFPIVLFIILVGAAGSGHDKTLGAGVLLKQYYTPSILAYGVMSACFMSIALKLVRQREDGVLKRMRGTPLPSWALIGGSIGSAVIVSSLLSIVCVVFAIVVYGVHLPAAHILPMVVTIALASLVFCALGIAVSSFIPNVDSAPAILNLPFFVMVFISGTYFPISGTMLTISKYLPLRPFIEALYKVFDPLQFGSSGWAWRQLGALLIWGVVSIVIAVRYFRWMPRRG
ncbi:MAG TPA: ABC transporter permease [Mycobacteriales bacterium]|nr:ABC transporter permease [Mycobacteriales bacterium]